MVHKNSDSTNNKTFYYRYPSSSSKITAASKPHKNKPKGNSSRDLAHSYSTLYNLNH
jgi:hypothetical protein